MTGGNEANVRCISAVLIIAWFNLSNQNSLVKIFHNVSLSHDAHWLTLGHLHVNRIVFTLLNLHFFFYCKSRDAKKKKFYLFCLFNLSHRKIPPWYFSVSISFKWCSVHPKAWFATEHFPTASLYLPLFHFRFVFPEGFCKTIREGKKAQTTTYLYLDRAYLKSLSSEKGVFPLVLTVASLSFTVHSLTLEGCSHLHLLNEWMFSALVETLVLKDGLMSMICDISGPVFNIHKCDVDSSAHTRWSRSHFVPRGKTCEMRIICIFIYFVIFNEWGEMDAFWRT